MRMALCATSKLGLTMAKEAAGTDIEMLAKKRVPATSCSQSSNSIRVQLFPSQAPPETTHTKYASVTLNKYSAEGFKKNFMWTLLLSL